MTEPTSNARAVSIESLRLKLARIHRNPEGWSKEERAEMEAAITELGQLREWKATRLDRRDMVSAENGRLAAERDSLRAELAAATRAKEEAEGDYLSLESQRRKQVVEFVAERSRAEALGARVEALVEAIRGCLGTTLPDWVRKRLETAIYSAPTADLSARDVRIRREALEDAWKRIVALGMGAEVIWVSAGMYVRDAIFNAAPPVSEGKEEVTWDAVEGAESYRLSITAPQTREEDGDE